MKNFGSLVNSVDVVLKLVIASVISYFVSPADDPGIEFETFLFIYISMWIGHAIYDLYIFLKENRKK